MTIYRTETVSLNETEDKAFGIVEEVLRKIIEQGQDEDLVSAAQTTHDTLYNLYEYLNSEVIKNDD